MASRVVSHWRSVMSRMGANRQFMSSTSPRLKPMSDVLAATSHYGESHPRKLKQIKGDWVPVYVALGMIALSVSLGLYTAKQQIAYSPFVRLNKKRRETLPEIVDPDRVVEEADRFINTSLFRKIGHILDIDELRSGMTDPTRPRDPFHCPRHVETLKSVGVNP